MNTGIEQVRDAETVEKMRAEIFRLSREDSLVRNIWDAADYGGASAEDRYTVLAYHALRERAKLSRRVLSNYQLGEFIRRTEPERIVPTPSEEPAMKFKDALIEVPRSAVPLAPTTCEYGSCAPGCLCDACM